MRTLRWVEVLKYALETTEDHSNAIDAVASSTVVIPIDYGSHPDDVVDDISSSRIFAIQGDDTGSRYVRYCR